MNTLPPAQAMAAVTQHAVNYSLPAPLIIHQPPYGSKAVEFSVAPHNLYEWLDTLVTTDETTEPIDSSMELLAGHERVCFTGVITTDRGDVPVELRSVRKIGPRLLAVPA